MQFLMLFITFFSTSWLQLPLFWFATSAWIRTVLGTYLFACGFVAPLDSVCVYLLWSSIGAVSGFLPVCVFQKVFFFFFWVWGDHDIGGS
jgi:hypothetical protein